MSEREVRRLLDKAEELLEECKKCGSLDCDECEELQNLLNEAKSKVEQVTDKRYYKKFIDDIEYIEDQLEELS